MTRHTSETVRAACERAGIHVEKLTRDPQPDGWVFWFVGGGRGVVESQGGELLYGGVSLDAWAKTAARTPIVGRPDPYHPAEVRAETLTPNQARIAELEGQVRVLREELAYATDMLARDGRDVTSMRAALAATEEK